MVRVLSPELGLVPNNILVDFVRRNLGIDPISIIDICVVVFHLIEKAKGIKHLYA